MNNKEFSIDFINGYRDLMLSKSSHDQIKHFNNNLKRFSHLLVYPFSHDDDSVKMQLLVGFADTFNIHQKDDKATMPEAMEQVRSGQDFLTISVDSMFTETLAISTSAIELLPIRKVEWSELINAPKLDDGEFSILKSAFLEYFNLDESAYQQGSDERFSFSDYFYKKNNKPEALELREVWSDTDGDKYGNIQTLVIWHGVFIGWVVCSGKWLDSYTASTVNLDQWSNMMDTLYANSGYKPGRNLKGVYVYDMEKDDVDDVTYVPGVSTVNYE